MLCYNRVGVQNLCFVVLGCALVIIMRECGGGVCMLAVCLVILSVVIYGEGL